MTTHPSDTSESGGTERAAPKRALTLALAAIAGYVDAFGYLTFGHMLLAHMSGNTAVGATHIAQGSLGEAWHRLAPIPSFVVGTALGLLASHSLRRRGIRRRLAAVLGAELLMFLTFFALATLAPATRGHAAALLAVAMGIQSAAARHVAGHDVRTTFVTGMLVAAVDETVLAWLERDVGHRSAVGLHGGIWLAFFVGAAVGTACTLRLGAVSVLVPSTAIGTLAVIDVFHPYAPTP